MVMIPNPHFWLFHEQWIEMTYIIVYNSAMKDTVSNSLCPFKKHPNFKWLFFYNYDLIQKGFLTCWLLWCERSCWNDAEWI